LYRRSKKKEEERIEMKTKSGGRRSKKMSKAGKKSIEGSLYTNLFNVKM